MSDRKKADFSILNYVYENKNSFDQQECNSVDGLVMTQIANMQLDDCKIDIQTGNTKTVKEIYDNLYYTNSLNNLSDEEKTLIKEMANSERYKDVILSNYVSDPVTNGISGFESIGADSNTEQFGAVTLTTYKTDRQSIIWLLGLQMILRL